MTLAQNSLLSAAARTISLRAIYKAGEAAACDTFRKMRCQDTDGEAVCPRCGNDDAYDIAARRNFKCKACHRQSSVTSGTIFASCKMDFVDLFAAICILVKHPRASLPSNCPATAIPSIRRPSYRPTSCARR